nr:hypothetical protein CFP56_78277 [Quercus suber]
MKWTDLTARHRNWDPVFDLVNRVSDTMVREYWANELFCVAAQLGCLPIMQRLLTRAREEGELAFQLLHGARQEKQRPPPARSLHQSIGEAVLGNHVDVVALLLAQQGMEAHLRYVNSRQENVLHLAAGRCNPAMFHQLAPHTRDLQWQTDYQGASPLLRIVLSTADYEHRLESVKILLLQNAANDRTHVRAGQQEALRAAVRLGEVDMCSLLVELGRVSPLSALIRDQDGQLVLRDRTPENDKNSVAISKVLVQQINQDASVHVLEMIR